MNEVAKLIEIDIHGATEVAGHRQGTEVDRRMESLKKTSLKAAYPKVLRPPDIGQIRRMSKNTRISYFMYLFSGINVSAIIIQL